MFKNIINTKNFNKKNFFGISVLKKKKKKKKLKNTKKKKKKKN